MIKYSTRWTDQDREYIKTNIGKVRPRTMAKVLNRTLQSVRAQIYLIKKQNGNTKNNLQNNAR
jgi:hypothetical protein